MALSSEMSAADVAVLTGNTGSNRNDSMWGGDFGAWIILFLIFGLFGWGGAGFGGAFGGGINSPAGQGYATRADINAGFAFNDLQRAVDGVSRGICDSTYALNNAINGVSMGMMQGFNGVERAMANQGYQMQAGFSGLQAQIADCCCNTQRAIEGVNYNLAAQSCDTRNAIANSTRDIIDNQNANARAVLDALTAQRIEAKDAKIAEQNQQIFQLQLAASQQAQNAYLTANQQAQTAEILRRTGHDCPIPAYVVQAPTPVVFPQQSCGCANGCGYQAAC